MNETKDLYNGLRWSCHSFCKIYGQWCGSYHLRALYLYEQPVHPIFGRWTSLSVSNDKEEMKDLYNGLRWACPTFWKIYGQWCCSCHLRALHPHEQAVHPIFGRWTSVFVSNDKEEMKNLYNGLRWSCPTFCKIYSQCYCSCPLHALYAYEQPVHLPLGWLTYGFVLNDKRYRRRSFTMDRGDPAILFESFTVNGVVMSWGMHGTSFNCLYNPTIGKEHPFWYQTTNGRNQRYL